MSRQPFVRSDPSEFRITDKTVYATWSTLATRIGGGSVNLSGSTQVRVARDLYDADDVEDICEHVKSKLDSGAAEGMAGARVRIGLITLSWWTLLELSESDRAETPQENR